MHLDYYSLPEPPDHLISCGLRQHLRETRLIVVPRLDCNCEPCVRSIFDRFEVGHGVSFVIVDLRVLSPFLFNHSFAYLIFRHKIFELQLFCD
jgi:hypothetical protein